MPEIPKKQYGPPQCLVPSCSKNAAANCRRGLCMGCHSHAKKMVEAGKTTWERLVSLGLASSIADSDPFTAAFNERNKGTLPEGP